MKKALPVHHFIATLTLATVMLHSPLAMARLDAQDTKALQAEDAAGATGIGTGAGSATIAAIINNSEDQSSSSAAPAEAPVPFPRPAFLDEDSSKTATTTQTTTTKPSTSADLSEFDNLDPHHIVPERPFREALTYLKDHESSFPNKNYMVVVDFTQPESAERMYIVNLKTGAVTRHLTSVGIGSDPHNTGKATSFSNAVGSDKTSLGFYRTAETYFGKHGLSLRLDGLSPTNSNARKREVVIHSAWYVQEDGKAKRAGHSDGCMALDPDVLKSVIGAIKQGALIYAWAGG